MPYNWHTRLLLTFVSLAMLSFVIVGALTDFFPALIPFRFYELWTIKGSLWSAVSGAWPVFIFGLALNVTILFHYDGYKKTPRELFVGGLGISLWAGIMEELCFRWLIFFGAIVLMPIIDFCVLGFMGLHVFKWFYALSCAVANFFTLGYLQDYLLGGHGWEVAAAMITTNGKFRNGHGYQGFTGFTVAWFIGMYFFWVTLTYGLIAAMLVHFIYDFCIFMLIVLDAKLEERSFVSRSRRLRA